MGISTKEELLSFKKVLFNYPEEFKGLKDKISNVDNEINDLLHFLELGELNENEYKKLAQALQKATRRRRMLKDRERELKNVIDFLSELNIEKDAEHNVNNLIHRSATLEESRKSRRYKIRVRNDFDWILNKGNNEKVMS